VPPAGNTPLTVNAAGPVNTPAPVEAETPATRAAVRALTRLSRALERRASAAGDLSLAHYRVLAAVAQGDERASRVATRFALGKPAVSASVEALCARGLLARGGDAGDQRAVSLALTPAGQQVLDDVEAAMEAELLEAAARTGAKTAVLEALALLGPALDERSAPPGGR
jgi:DNA-binding MarR family transcriptional regulator